ncbi:MAG: DUF4124 domain-containing protein [Pseudomonadota bacterium]
MRLISTLCAGLIAATCCAAQAADAYKWIDEQGRVHYGDRPGNAGAREVPIKSAPAPAPDSHLEQRRTQQDKLLRAFEDERKLKQQHQAQAKAEAEQRDKECKLAKLRLKNYEKADYLYAETDDGKRNILSDQERQQALEEAKQAVEYWCK